MTDATPDAFIELAHRLADAARPVARRYFRSGIAIDDKPDASPVTRADREIEAAMRALIEAAFPDHGILGEEHGALRTDAEWVWVLDPIDGTQGFVTGKPLFGTLIGLARHGKPYLGVIDAPAMGERWIGVAGRTTRFQDGPVSVRACAAIGEAWGYATSPHMFGEADFADFERLRGQVKKMNYGADCYAYGLLAGGHVDLVCEASLQPYDYMALVPVVEGAGGVITDWEGAPLHIGSDGRVVAAGDERVHARAVDILKERG